MKLIVWLGNPWKEYATTRHNIGFMMIDDFLKGGKWDEWQGKWEYENKRKGEIAEVNIDGQKVVFLKPMEFMNRSWWAVSALANFYKIEPKDILVIHDDIDLLVGKIQLKLWWSSAGHNWLKSIIEKLWITDFRRLRIWVDRPKPEYKDDRKSIPIYNETVADYVLSNFKKEEKNLIDDKMNEIEKYIRQFLLS